MQEYENGQIQNTYKWDVTNSTNSGIRSKYLKLLNPYNFKIKRFEISFLDEDKMILIYQRDNNMGISKPVELMKQ